VVKRDVFAVATRLVVAAALVVPAAPALAQPAAGAPAQPTAKPAQPPAWARAAQEKAAADKAAKEKAAKEKAAKEKAAQEKAAANAAAQGTSATPAPPARTTPPSPADTAKARALFEAGGRAYDNAQYDAALQAFKQAYALVDKDGILFSIAQTERRLFTTTGSAQHRDEAMRLYRTYLDRVKTGGRRGEAAKALEDLTAAGGVAAPAPVSGAPAIEPPAKATRFYISSTTPGARVSVDGGAETPANLDVVVSQGEHKVRFSAPGFRERELVVKALPDELVPVSLDLEELPGTLSLSTADGAEINVDGRYVGDAPLTAPLALPSGKHFVVSSKDGHLTKSDVVELERGKTRKLDLDLDTTEQRDLSYVVFAGAGAALLTSGVFVGLAFMEQGNARDISDLTKTGNISAQDVHEYDAARNRRDRYTIAAAATGGGAGLLAVVGLGMFVIDPADKAVAAPAFDGATPTNPAPRTAPPSLELEDATASIGPGGGVVQARFRF
jgi:hypothetical protein